MKVVAQVQVHRITEDSVYRSIEFGPPEGEVDLTKPDATGCITFRKFSGNTTENPWQPSIGDKLTLTLTSKE